MIGRSTGKYVEEKSLMTSVCDQVKPLIGWNKHRKVLLFALSQYKFHIGAAIIGFVALGIYVYCNSDVTIRSLWSNYFSVENLVSATVQLITFLIISSMLYKNMENEWLASLNEFLSVYFKDGDQLRICCRYARLPHPSDIRSLGQSLGQSVKMGRLPLAPSLISAPAVVEIETTENACTSGRINNGMPFIHHRVTFPLTGEIKSVQDGEQIKDKDEREKKRISLDANQFFLWDYPFEDMGRHNLKSMSEAPDIP